MRREAESVFEENQKTMPASLGYSETPPKNLKFLVIIKNQALSLQTGKTQVLIV